jgi:hypothetical protein
VSGGLRWGLVYLAPLIMGLASYGFRVEHSTLRGERVMAAARPAVDKASFVFKVCFTDVDPDVSLRVVNVTGVPGPEADKARADMCGFETDCGHAEVLVFLDPQAARSIWLSTTAERCR